MEFSRQALAERCGQARGRAVNLLASKCERREVEPQATALGHPKRRGSHRTNVPGVGDNNVATDAAVDRHDSQTTETWAPGRPS